jgi:thioredoxin-related protein
MPGFAPVFRKNLWLLLILVSAISKLAMASESQNSGGFHGAMQTEYPDWFKTSFMELEEDILDAREAGKRLMIVFHQDGCPYCNVFVEQNLAQKDIEETMREHFDVIEINMWGDREVTNVDGEMFTEKLFAERLQVQFTPTVLFFDDEGQHALRINGYYPPEKFRLALEYVINKKEQQQSFNEFIASRYQPPEPTNSAGPATKAYINGDASKLGAFAKEDKPLLLLFEQSDCSNCTELDNKVLMLDETRDLMEKFNVVRVDMWGNGATTDLTGNPTTERELAKQLDVSYAPTLIFYASDGATKNEVIRSESWFKRFHTQSLMDYVASGAWREQPSFQRYISARAEHIQESGKDVNIFD